MLEVHMLISMDQSCSAMFHFLQRQCVYYSACIIVLADGISDF